MGSPLQTRNETSINAVTSPWLTVPEEVQTLTICGEGDDHSLLG